MFGRGDYTTSRYLLHRALGFVYLLAFLCALNQFIPLAGEHGLLPAPEFLRITPLRLAPTLFRLAPTDAAFRAAAWLGIALSSLMAFGLASRYGAALTAAVWALIWFLYLSFVIAGQAFYSFGWESVLLEAGFLAIFLGSDTVAVQPISLWLLRWLEFRTVFGAGLARIRGDSCWRNLTCLDYHFETQPAPGPLSWYFHHAPTWAHHSAALLVGFSELIVPFGYLLPQPYASVAGLFTIGFQLLMMMSGNLAWLNLLVIVLALPLLTFPASERSLRLPSLLHRAVVGALGLLMIVLSARDPVRNMLSPNQANRSRFTALHLAGTFGVFDFVNRNRFEVVLEGSAEPYLTPTTQWREYEFQGKPGKTSRRPPLIAPYHLRLDWQMWSAAAGEYYSQPWFLPLVARLLQNDAATLSLLGRNPFPAKPPRLIRAILYRYEFTSPEERRQTGDWWRRERVGEWLAPVSLEVLRGNGYR